MSSSTTSVTPTPRMRRRTKIVLVVLAVLAVVFTPLAINGLFSGALANADTNLSTVPAAIVNNDQMTTTTNADGTQSVNFAGRGLVTELTGAGQTGFDWKATSADDAAKGLEDGRYYAVLTIPSDFSATLNTLGTPDPKQGLIDITTDASHGYLSGIVASTVASAVQSGFGQTVTAQVVNGIYTSFGTVGTSLTDAANGATQLGSGADQLATGATQLADGATQLSGGAGQLTTGLTQYTDGVSGLATGLDQLRTGTSQLGALGTGVSDYVSGAQQLSDGFAQAIANPQLGLTPEQQAGLGLFGAQLQGYADQGAPLKAGAAALPQLSSGIASAASGADQLAAGGPALVSGAQQLTDGAAQLAPGATQLSTGATQLGDGARTLASGLTTGAQQITANASGDSSSAAGVIAQPVKVDVSTQNQVTNVGQIVSTILVPTALWIGALALFLWLRPFSRAVLASSATTARLTLRTFGRAAVIAAGQAVLLVLFLHLALGVAWSSFPATLGFSLIVALAFAAFHQFLTTAFGRVGAVISLVLLALQLASTGGLYPIEILSGPFQALSAITPLSYAVAGVQAILTGGDAGTVVQAALVMAGVLVVSVLLAGAALARRRRPVEIGWLVPKRASRAPSARARLA
ncbi:YhgE/Pip domain-containing protein [Herbiconiux solani]|uniref:YhgE/Pip domain-containing protein n=1 Tax=Herbiconiux solani TaxID=661329 RepID=UPI000825FBC9|nr:YhgE/Pip domain-containing protein [Herbiconiux solani]